MEKILFCANGRWEPSVVDASMAGWFTVGACATAAIVCLRPLSRRKPVGGHNFWMLIFIGLIALLINHLTNIQGGLGAIFTCAADIADWQGTAAIYRVSIFLGIIFIGLATLGYAILTLWRDVKKIWPSLVAIGFLFLLIAMRVYSGGSAGPVVNTPIATMSLSRLIELVAVMMILFNASLLPKRVRRY